MKFYPEPTQPDIFRDSGRDRNILFFSGRACVQNFQIDPARVGIRDCRTLPFVTQVRNVSSTLSQL